MGTNYYMQRKSTTCKSCKHTEDSIHIGKSSYGWEFSFQGYGNDWNQPVIKTYQDWQDVLQDDDTYIINEYQEIVPKEEFYELVVSKSGRNHASEYKEGNWLDPKGYSFTGNDFL